MRGGRILLAAVVAIGLLGGSSASAMAQAPTGGDFRMVEGTVTTGDHVVGTGTLTVEHGVNHYRGYEFVVPSPALDEPRLAGEMTVRWDYDQSPGLEPTMPYWGDIRIESDETTLIHTLRDIGALEQVAGTFGLGGAREGWWEGTFTGAQLAGSNVIHATALLQDLAASGLLDPLVIQGIEEQYFVARPADPVVLFSWDPQMSVTIPAQTPESAIDVQAMLYGRGAYEGLSTVMSLTLPFASLEWQVSGMSWIDQPSEVAIAHLPLE